jgi:hypothetical protein
MADHRFAFFAGLRRLLCRALGGEVARHQRQAREARSECERLRRNVAQATAIARRKLAAVEHQRDEAVKSALERERELKRARLEIDKASHALSVAEEENRRLWALAQRDQARVEAERARYDRRRAELEYPSPVP